MSSAPTLPKIITTPPRRPPRASFASPIDIVPKSPAARRMSMSATSQHASRPLKPTSFLEPAPQHPQIITSILLASIVILATIYSCIYSTSLNTSLPHSHLPERTFYFSRKSNIFNTLFVKKAWFWTSLIYLLHLASSPPSRSSRFSRLIAWVGGTIGWLGFTTWFFGAGLGDRVIEYTGGGCGVILPDTLNLDTLGLGEDTKGGLAILQVGELKVVSLPSRFCTLRLPLNPTTHPSLFDNLPDTPELAQALRPRWHKGFDISGHTFLLTLSTLLLVRELYPSWKLLFSEAHRSGGNVGRGGGVHLGVTLAGMGLVGLWVWMLLMTSVWFHNPPEKLSGLALGLLAGTVINLFTPESTPSILKQHPLPKRLNKNNNDNVFTDDSPPAEDENAARRGETVDEGKIKSVDIDQAIRGSDFKGRSKQE